MHRETINPLDLAGDSTPDERQKAIEPLAPFSRTYAAQAKALQSMPPEVYAAIEPKLIHEIRENLASSGRLFEFRHRDDSGRLVTTSEGDIRSWMDAYDSPPVRIKFNKHAGQKFEPGRWVDK